MNFLIITGGNIDKDIALTMLTNKNIFIIAVDKGLALLYELKRMPDLIMGDYDSVPGEILSYYKDRQAKIMTFPANKDATDTQLAVEEAISRGADHITILGATGSRLDHTICNINILGIALKHKIPCEIVDSHNVIRLLDESTEIKEKEQFGKYISFLPYTEQVEGITLEGFCYPLTNYTLRKDTSIAISNELAEKEGKISFTKGILIMLQTKD